MIKRRFYKMEHGDRDDASNQSLSSSDSDSDIQVEAEEPESSSDDDAVEQPCSDPSGYKTEDSSANETLVDVSGFPLDSGNERESPEQDQVLGKSGSEFQQQYSKTVADEESPSVDLPGYVVKRKSTFKCRICPRIVCLNKEALRAHLKSKRHSRSEKLLSEGRLKTVLNSDGKLDVEEDTPAFYARILASSQALPRKKNKQEDKRKPRKKRMRYDNKKSKGS